MTRALVKQSFRYANGRVASRESVDVFVRGTNTRPIVYHSNNSTIIANPLQTDEYGNLAFYVEEGLYEFSALGLRSPFDSDAADNFSSRRFVYQSSIAQAVHGVVHTLSRDPASILVMDLDSGLMVDGYSYAVSDPSLSCQIGFDIPLRVRITLS